MATSNVQNQGVTDGAVAETWVSPQQVTSGGNGFSTSGGQSSATGGSIVHNWESRYAQFGQL